MMTSSRSAPWVLWGRGILSLLPRRGRRRPSACAQAPTPPPPSPHRPHPAHRPPWAPRPRTGLLGFLLDGLGDLRLGFAHRDALGVNRLRLLLRNDHLFLDAPAPLGHPSALADLPAQVVELRPPHVAAGGHLELLDLRRVQRERPLDADAEGLLAHGERLARAAALALDHDALEDLGAAAVPLDHLEVNAHAVARGESRPLLQRSLLEVFDDCAHEVMMVGARPERRLKRRRCGGSKNARGPRPRAATRNASGDAAAVFVAAVHFGPPGGVLARAATPALGRGRPRAGCREPPSRGRRRAGCSGDTPARPRGPRCRTPPPRSPRRRGRPGSFRRTASLITIAGSSPPAST